MRTKTLLLTAAISAAGASASMAQVYSVNAVGYVNASIISANGLKGTVIANPLNGTNNNLNTILPLTDPYDGTLVYRYDVAAQNYSDAITFFGGGVGWFTPNPDPNAQVIAPGEGFFIFPFGPDPLNVTFVGEVPQGTLSNPLPPPSNFSIRSSVVPQTARLGDAVTAGTLLFAAEDGDIVYTYDAASSSFSDAYTYFDMVGWFNPNDPAATPNGPNIPVASGFFIQKSPTATKTAWVRTFSVNP